MSSHSVYRRQMRLLADQAHWARHRINFPIKPDVYESMEFDTETGRLFDKGQPIDRLGQGASDLAYDLNHLVALRYLRINCDGARPFLYLTTAGTEQVRLFERGLIAKAIDKQPATALNLALGFVSKLIFCGNRDFGTKVPGIFILPRRAQWLAQF